MAYIDDLEEVQNVIQLYIDGSNGDVAKLEQAFHPSAWMFGLFGTTRTDFPITQFFDGARHAGHGWARLPGDHPEHRSLRRCWGRRAG